MAYREHGPPEVKSVTVVQNDRGEFEVKRTLTEEVLCTSKSKALAEFFAEQVNVLCGSGETETTIAAA